jgi:hypothetical protein
MNTENRRIEKELALPEGSVKSGTRSYEETWLNWWVVPASVELSDLSDALDLYDCYRGPGQYFQETAYIQQTQTRILVTQRAGYDV